MMANMAATPKNQMKRNEKAVVLEYSVFMTDARRVQ